MKRLFQESCLGFRTHVEGGKRDDEALVGEAGEVSNHVVHLLGGCGTSTDWGLADCGFGTGNKG